MQNRSFAAAVKAAFPHTIPIMTGYLAVGMAYGVLMASKGYGFLWAGFVSAFAFCGSMQYVAITLLTTAFDPLQAFVLSLMVNARHLFFSLALLPKYRGLGRLRYFMIYTLSDENFSLSSSVEPPEDTDPTLFYFAMSFLTWLYWVAFSMLGGLLGGLVGGKLFPKVPVVWLRRACSWCCSSSRSSRKRTVPPALPVWCVLWRVWPFSARTTWSSRPWC